MNLSTLIVNSNIVLGFRKNLIFLFFSVLKGMRKRIVEVLKASDLKVLDYFESLNDLEHAEILCCNFSDLRKHCKTFYT